MTVMAAFFGLVRIGSIVSCFGGGGDTDIQHGITHGERGWTGLASKIEGKTMFLMEREGQRRNMYIYLRVGV